MTFFILQQGGVASSVGAHRRPYHKTSTLVIPNRLRLSLQCRCKRRRHPACLDCTKYARNCRGGPRKRGRHPRTHEHGVDARLASIERRSLRESHIDDQENRSKGTSRYLWTPHELLKLLELSCNFWKHLLSTVKD